MSDEKQKHAEQSAPLSGFDAVVLLIAAVLVVAIAGVTYWNQTTKAGAMVAYLYPLSNSASQETTIPNLWLAPVDAPDRARALTDSPMGIFDFGVSPDGRFIAYSGRDAESRLLD